MMNITPTRIIFAALIITAAVYVMFFREQDDYARYKIPDHILGCYSSPNSTILQIYNNKISFSTNGNIEFAASISTDNQGKFINTSSPISFSKSQNGKYNPHKSETGMKGFRIHEEDPLHIYVSIYADDGEMIRFKKTSCQSTKP